LEFKEQATETTQERDMLKTMEDKKTIRELLEYRAQHTPDSLYCVYEDWKISCSALMANVNRLTNGLREIGVKPGHHVAVMLRNHPDHIFTVFALATLGVVWVPVNINLRGPSLDFILEKSRCSTVIADVEFWDRLGPILASKKVDIIIFRNGRNIVIPSGRMKVLDFSAVDGGEATPLYSPSKLDEIRGILFTSGTTGEPKGVLMTERMLKACAIGAKIISDALPGDVFLFWEPIYHSAGIEICILALMEQITLAMVPRFSASRFWEQVRKYRATKIHYLGGIIDILLKSHPSQRDKDHSVRNAFGGGICYNPDGWREFESRFGIKINECYGLTEGSGFTTVNKSGKVGSIGKPLSYFEVKIVNNEGKPLGAGNIGEIIVRGREPGLITPGYLGNPEATAEALREGWLYTGDLGCYDAEGDFYFKGRKKDSIRRRGENISAWEVERVLDFHPKIQKSAVIGVDADIGEQELKAFIICAIDVTLEPLEIIKWCESRLPYYQIPRYIAFLDSFEKTITERIRKEKLSKDITDCWDLERSGYRIRRV
jgi:crotonobetaine/carnitine-CoA ligase